MVFLSISLAIDLGKISLNFLGLLSSNTTSEYHLELKAVDRDGVFPFLMQYLV
jgi:hypothetical protein